MGVVVHSINGICLCFNGIQRGMVQRPAKMVALPTYGTRSSRSVPGRSLAEQVRLTFLEYTFNDHPSYDQGLLLCFVPPGPQRFARVRGSPTDHQAAQAHGQNHTHVRKEQRRRRTLTANTQAVDPLQPHGGQRTTVRPARWQGPCPRRRRA